VELDRGRQSAIIDVNMRATTDLMLRFLPDMMARGSGAVLNVGSVAGFMAGPRMAVYFASKAYLVSLSQALMREVRHTGVTVTCLCPGPLRTPFLTRAGADQIASFKALHKLGTAEAARAGWDAMKAGRTLCVPGFAAKFAVMATRLLPRSALLAITTRMQRKR
jgi:short-subunit dehydrogenase